VSDPPVAAPAIEARPRRHWGPALLFAAGVAVVVALTVFVISRDEGYTFRVDPQTDNAYVGGDVTQIAAREQGYLTNLPIADNQFVHAGDLIATIEDDDYRAERDQAQAALQAARARLASIDAQKIELAAEIARSHSGEAGSVAATGSTEPELARQEIIVHTDAGVRRALEVAEADQKRDVAAVAASRAQVLVRERQEVTLEAQRREAAATVAARQADLDLATLNLGWTRIVAPVDGTLGARLVRVGDLMAAGTRVVSITPLDSVWVDANFTERQIPNVRVGQRARLRLDTFPRDLLAGRVVGISPVTGGRIAAVPPDNTTGNFTKVPARVTVRIAILWGDSGRSAHLLGLVRPGMSALATVLTRGAD
jgi:membrane fusion protein, multidrug efflux system